ncbi:MAG TPA: LysR family transcriptional regulator [Kofleriaceae bacterium]|nr:LysR family transcriptional regulator [Kofleriaceae bacterium]
MDLDPRYLQAFVAVGRALSFSRAATTLHRTQPAVSYQIHQLEEQLGARLFDRTTRRLTLTAAGVRLLDVCERFFADFGRLAGELRDPEATATMPVRIASVSGFGRYVLFPVLERLAAVRYSLRYPTADQVFASLHDGTVDVGFVYLPIVSSRLVTTEVWDEELVLIVPARSGPRSVPRTIDAFANQPFVTYDESEYVFGAWFQTTFRRRPQSLVSAYHFEELEEVIATVAAGRGWSIVPDHCAAHDRRVRILRHPRRRVRNMIHAVTRATAHAHPAVAAILDALRTS